MFEHRIEELNEKNAEAMMERSDEKRTYTVDEIQDILSISRPTAYNLVKKMYFTASGLADRSEFQRRALMTG